VKYIGRILAAIRDDEHRPMPGSNSLLIPPSAFQIPPSDSPHPPLSPPVLRSLQSEEGSPGLPASQTLAETLGILTQR
jgi:hypothetical protein